MINPVQMMLNQMMNSPQVKNNPMAQNVMKMYKGGDSKGLRDMMSNLSKEKGIDLEDYSNKLKSQMGFNK